MSNKDPLEQAATEAIGLDDEGLNNALVGKLLEVLAHDLRNPLAALCSNLDYLKSLSGAMGKDVAEAIDDGVVSCDGLAHLTNNLDLLAQALRRVSLGSVMPMRLKALVSGAVESCGAAARSHELTLRVSPMTHEQDVLVLVSRLSATRAIANLVRNSIQHAPSGSVVELSVRQEADRGVVTVADAGQVLLAEHAGAFTAAGQVDHVDTRMHYRYSRGLGLFSARLGALACGGEVQSFPREGRGGNQLEISFPRA